MTAHLLHADARAIPLRDGSVDAVLTSPPYNCGKDYPCDDWGEDWDGYFAFLTHCYAECRRVACGPVAWVLPIMINGMAVAFWPGYPWRYACPVIRGSSRAMEAHSASLWMDAPFYIGGEILVVDQLPDGRKKRPTVMFIPQPWIGPKLRNRPRHPAAFPEEFIAEFTRIWPEVKSVCDPFGGTGTVAVAAQRRGLTAVTMDLDPRWVRVQQRELAQGSLFAKTSTGSGGSKYEWRRFV